MTSLTISADPATGRRPRRSGLAWNTWHQHRLALIGLGAVFAFFAIRLILTGLPLHATYAQYLAHRCVTQRHPGCARLLNQMGTGAEWVTSFPGMVVLPGLVGVFAGAPLIAREFENGTFRLAQTQGVRLRRQLAITLLIIGAVVALGSCLLGLLAMWCLQPFHRIALSPDSGISFWWPDYFNITAAMLPAWALLDFSLGALAGAAIRRTVPAMAATLAAVIAIAVLGTGFAVLQQSATLTGRLLSIAPAAAPATPLVGQLRFFEARSEVPAVAWPALRRTVNEVNAYPEGWPGPGGSVQVGGWFTGPGGHRLSVLAAQRMLNQIPVRVAPRPALLRQWLAARHIRYWIGYQPASRYWLFQGAAALLLIMLAVAAAFGAVRLACRRT
ncbi:MAG TPA: ABC transporter permease subunit [Streptosporangiaceae bacterium]